MMPCVAPLGGTVSHKLKGCRFNSRSEHTPRFPVASLQPAGMPYSRQPVNVSLSHTYLSLSKKSVNIIKMNKVPK